MNILNCSTLAICRKTILYIKVLSNHQAQNLFVIHGYKQNFRETAFPCLKFTYIKIVLINHFFSTLEHNKSATSYSLPNVINFPVNSTLSFLDTLVSASLAQKILTCLEPSVI